MKTGSLEVKGSAVQLNVMSYGKKNINHSIFHQIQDECILDYVENKFELNKKDLETVWGKVYVRSGRTEYLGLVGFFILWQKKDELRKTFFSTPLLCQRWVSLYYQGRLDSDNVCAYTKLYDVLNALPQIFID